MKTTLMIYPAVVATLFFSCGESKQENSTEESIEAQDEMSGEVHEGDTTMIKRDGTVLDNAAGLSDYSEIQQLNQDDVVLPQAVLTAIGKDKTFNEKNIAAKRKFEEGGVTYYEIQFKISDNKTKTVTYSEDGKMKP